MVTRYDVISSRWSSHDFLMFSVIKVNLVDKTKLSTYLCVIFHDNRTKLTSLAVFNSFLTVGKIQDGDHVW